MKKKSLKSLLTFTLLKIRRSFLSKSKKCRK
jgi:hypothetical protein